MHHKIFNTILFYGYKKYNRYSYQQYINAIQLIDMTVTDWIGFWTWFICKILKLNAIIYSKLMKLGFLNYR